jgi:hypothetical protein
MGTGDAPIRLETQREAFLRSRAELFVLVSRILEDYAPEWKCDPLLVAGLVVLDVVGWEALNTAAPETKAEVEALLRDVRPIVESVMACGTPFSGRGRIQ